MPSKKTTTQGGGTISRKLLAVAPEYRFAVYKQILAKRHAKRGAMGSPVLPGSFENPKRK